MSFECHVLANPAVNEIGWKYEDKILSPNVDDIVMSGNSLFINNVTRHHSGKYRCIAANSEGDGESDDILLKVLCEYYFEVLKLTIIIIYYTLHIHY